MRKNGSGISRGIRGVVASFVVAAACVALSSMLSGCAHSGSSHGAFLDDELDPLGAFISGAAAQPPTVVEAVEADESAPVAENTEAKTSEAPEGEKAEASVAPAAGADDTAAATEVAKDGKDGKDDKEDTGAEAGEAPDETAEDESSPESLMPVQDISFSPSGEPILRTGYIIQLTVMVADKAYVGPLEAQISALCEIQLPLVGSVDCTGLTLNGLRSRLTTRYSEYFNNPEVRAAFVVKSAATSPWGRVFVGGRVRREGWVSIPATRVLRVSEAIQQAGGFGTYARRDKIRVTRTNEDGKRETINVDLEDMVRRGKIDNDILLKHGDAVWVKETSI